MKNLYLIQTNIYSYDEFDWFVICAENEIEAENFLKENKRLWDFSESKFVLLWEANALRNKWIVLSSFNAW